MTAVYVLSSLQLGKTDRLLRRPMTQADAYRMIRRRAKAAGIHTKIGNPWSAFLNPCRHPRVIGETTRSLADLPAGRVGEIRDRSYENQRHRSSGLNLLVAAIILWNTVYLQRAIDYLRTRMPVSIVAGSVKAGMSPEEIQREYDLSLEDIQAALDFRKDLDQVYAEKDREDWSGLGCRKSEQTTAEALNAG
jgi:Tn3 transposase DDE domain/Protein of unknown function (DUF433)